MDKYNNWNIHDLLQEQTKITAEIQARLNTVVAMESHFLTHNPKATAEQYKEFMETVIDVARKGLGDDKQS